MARYEPAWRGDFDCFVTYSLPRRRSSSRPSQGEGEVCEKDGLMVAKLAYRPAREPLQLVKSCSNCRYRPNRRFAFAAISSRGIELLPVRKLNRFDQSFGSKSIRRPTSEGPIRSQGRRARP